MSRRRIFIDRSVGETRGVVTLEGRPERLIIVRDGQPAAQDLGARVVARVRSIQRGTGLVFVDLGEGPDAVFNLKPDMGRIVEGGWIEAEIRSEAHGDKGATLRWLGPAEGPCRLLASGPGLEDQLTEFAKDSVIEQGAKARAVADQAQEEALETAFPLPGGGMITVEPTRALTAIDVDLVGREGEGPKRVASAANLVAIAEAARVLRLKGLGGLVVIDLAGRGQDGPQLLAAARGAFAADQPGVALGKISRFGTLELTVPRRRRPSIEALADGRGRPTVATSAMNLLRALEREGEADRGGRFEGAAEPEIAAVASAFTPRLTERLGARFLVRPDPALQGFEVRHL